VSVACYFILPTPSTPVVHGNWPFRAFAAVATLTRSPPPHRLCVLCVALGASDRAPWSEPLSQVLPLSDLGCAASPITST